MQRVYEPENLMEGELLQQMLASEGIEAHLVGRHLLGGTGELPIFGLLGLEVDKQVRVPGNWNERDRGLLVTWKLPEGADIPKKAKTEDRVVPMRRKKK